MDSLSDTPLAAEFPPASEEQWRALVEGVLKGRSFEDRLVSTTYDGLRIAPLYGRGDTAAAPLRGAHPWQVLQRIDHPDADQARALALQDLENGADGLMLVCAGAVGSCGTGIAPAAFARALEGVVLEAGVQLDLDCAGAADAAADALVDLVRQRGLDPRALAIRFGRDPIGAMAQRGSAALPWHAAAREFARRIAALADAGFRGPFAAADGRPVHAAGGSEAQELAFVLASAVAYLRALEAHGIAVEDARGMISFRLAADADQFLTIAKFRALRRLWARVETACGLAPAPATVTGETAWRMLTRHDPHVNILRATIATLAAGVGGADAVAVLPFSLALGLPDSFARRVARNTQLLLIAEAHLAKVADPAAGSGAFEALTTELDRTAWALFQQIEAGGGIAAALTQGVFQMTVAAVRAARAAAVAHRREPITGTSAFPLLREAPVTVLPAVAPAAPSTRHTITFDALAPQRSAEPFERLRAAAERARQDGRPPRIFLALLGAPADSAPRAAFARSLFEAGGIEAIASEGAFEPAGEVSAFTASGAALACLCGSDEAYAADAAACARALARAGAKGVYLAGRPGALDEPERAAISGFVHDGCDALAVLAEAHAALGIAAE